MRPSSALLLNMVFRQRAMALQLPSPCSVTNLLHQQTLQHDVGHAICGAVSAMLIYLPDIVFVGLQMTAVRRCCTAQGPTMRCCWQLINQNNHVCLLQAVAMMDPCSRFERLILSIGPTSFDLGYRIPPSACGFLRHLPQRLNCIGIERLCALLPLRVLMDFAVVPRSGGQMHE